MSLKNAKPDWLSVPGTILLQAEVGSGVHGLAIQNTDDRDEMGICVEPYAMACGLHAPFEQFCYRSAAERGGAGAPSEPGDLDLTIYSLRKWTRLALQGNPSILVLLFAPDFAVVQQSSAGEQLRKDLAPLFASRQAGQRFLGYLIGQRQRLLGERGQKNVNRKALTDRYGYDTKYAGHMVRLGYQGIEFMETGRITLPMPATERRVVRSIRQGDYSLNDVLSLAGRLEVSLRDLLTTSPLPMLPDTQAVEAWMLDQYWAKWSREENSEWTR